MPAGASALTAERASDVPWFHANVSVATGFASQVALF